MDKLELMDIVSKFACKITKEEYLKRESHSKYSSDIKFIFSMKQELIFSLGGEWVSGEKKTPILLDTKFLTVDKEVEIAFLSAADFPDYDYRQIYYNNIFLTSKCS